MAETLRFVCQRAFPSLGAAPRGDFVTVDANLSSAGIKLTNLLDPKAHFDVETGAGRSAARVPLAAQGMAILRQR